MIKNYIIPLCLLFSIQVSAQEFDIEKYNVEKERILNVMLNSIEFDSIYVMEQVYFASNELLSMSSGLKLKREEVHVTILERDSLKAQNLDYVSLGDFTMPKEKPEHVRLQVYSSSTRKTLNLRMEKNDDDWKIVNHLIMED